MAALDSSAHISSYLPPFCHLCNSTYYSFKALSHNCPLTHTHLMTLKASLMQISADDEQECVWLPRGDKHKRISISSLACLQTIYNILTACRLRRRPRWIPTRPQVVFLNAATHVRTMNKTLETYMTCSLQTCQTSFQKSNTDTGERHKPQARSIPAQQKKSKRTKRKSNRKKPHECKWDLVGAGGCYVP